MSVEGVGDSPTPNGEEEEGSAEVEGAVLLLLLPEDGEGGRRADIQEDQSSRALTDHCHCPLSVGEDIQEDQSTGALSLKLLDLPG